MLRHLTLLLLLLLLLFHNRYVLFMVLEVGGKVADTYFMGSVIRVKFGGVDYDVDDTYQLLV